MYDLNLVCQIHFLQQYHTLPANWARKPEPNKENKHSDFVFTQLLHNGVTAENSWVEFRVFLLDWLPNQSRTRPILLCIYSLVRTYGFILFFEALVRGKTLTASSRIWTRIANSIFIHHHHHHHHVVPPARISLTISRHFSLSFIASGRSSGLHPVSSHNCCI